MSGKDIGRPCKDGRCPAGMACISNACEPATDAGVQDAGSSDAGAVDGGAPDAGSPDAGAGDGGILLLEGHIGSGGGTVDDGNGLRLLDPGFETGDRTCTSSLCGQGGIQP